MNSIEQNAETLSSFGLTVKQAKVYLALVFSGTAVVGEISKLSKVRREEVYRILPKLEKMGLIEKTLSTPVKLKAASVENALSILIRNEEENARNHIAELTKRKAEFLEHFRTSAKETKTGGGDQFVLTSEKAASLGKMDTIITSAHTQIEYVASREKLLQFIKYFSESLKEAISRGVKIRFISNPPKGQDELRAVVNQMFGGNRLLTVRYIETLPNHFLVVDDSEVLVATSIAGYLADYPVLWSNNLPHVSVYGKLFDDLWDSSVESVALNVNSDVERLRGFVAQMKAPQHVMLLYETVEAKLKVLLTYVKNCLDAGEATVYVCSESSVEEVTAAMRQFGLDTTRYQKSGALRIVDYTQYFLIDGCFSIDTTAKLCKGYYDDAITKGFKGLRVASEMACFFKHNLITELVDYDRSLHKTGQVPVVAIYAYCADHVMNCSKPVNVYSELVKTHGNVLFSWIDGKLGRIAIS